ncbi:MAG: hypothetical protein JXB03_10980, partial [Spirochaetales bacterium]|nr:hypothetical protein [Spirochaetales bacterium]
STAAGIEFSGHMEDLYRAHALLHVPSRILMEAASFRSGAVEELYKKGFAHTWELYLNPRIPLKVHARVRNSRISHEGSAADTLFQSIADRFSDPPFNERIHRYTGRDDEADTRNIQRIYLNMEENHCRITLDTSGVHLHKRGFRQLSPDAPIRETLAAAFLQWVFKRTGPRACVLDPMCGSGTFPVEWAQCSSPTSCYNTQTRRPFLFEQLPWHRPGAWEFSLRQPVSPVLPPLPLFASDIDAKAVEIAAAYLASAGLSDRICLTTGNFFTLDAAMYPGTEPGLIITNLPYGVRKPEGTGDFYQKFIRHVKKSFPGWSVACIGPENVLRGSLKESVSFFNGGLRVIGGILDI